jgi:t-SNARE complex subunit (syntaxin)
MENQPNRTHETQGTTDDQPISSSINPMFENAQRIEGGSAPKKIIWNTLPKAIRVFGYIIITIIIVMVIFALATNFL